MLPRITLTAVVLVILVSATVWGASPAKVVYVASIAKQIDGDVASFVAGVMGEAQAAKASAVVLDINTLGGALDASVELRDQILDSKVPTIAFIDQRAISAGALISLAAGTIVMAPGATIGAATPVNFLGEKAPEKIVSYWRAEMRATAERRKRPVRLADAMVDESVEIPGVVERGKLLTLTAEEALAQNLADHVAGNIDGVLQKTGLSGAQVVVPKEPEGFFSVWLKAPIVWFLVGLVMLTLEFSAPGIVIVFFGIGAWITAVTCLWLDVSLNTQLAIFLVSSAVLLLLLRTYLKSVFTGYVISKGSPMEELREYIGQKAVVTDSISPARAGKIEFHGTAWEAESDETLAAGESVEITDRDNITFRVKSLRQGVQ